MATTGQAPDPKSFQKWEEAFAYPIPAVRRMEQQLRTDISSNRDRLRSLVGGSYRDLLGTADTIIDMDGRMHGVEALVAQIGRRCNSGLLERTKSQSRQMLMTGHAMDGTASGKYSRRHQAGARGVDYVFASQLAVFKACPDTILRLLKKNESLLLIAKVLVISRILYAQLSKAKSPFPELIESIFERLGRIRAKILEAIDHRLGRIPSSNTELIDAMSAFALAAHASAAGILRKFQDIRSAAMIRSTRHGPDSGQRPVKAVEIWLQTLRDVPTIFPRRLSQALDQLKHDPILSSKDVNEISALDLDIHRNWIGEEVIGFVPYIRHDDLDLASAKKSTSTWAPNAFEKLLKNLESSLDSIDDMVEITKMRHECLIAWFAGSAKVTGIPRSQVLEGLRGVFADRLGSLIESRCASLEDISSLVNTVVEKWPSPAAETTAPSMWNEQTTNMSVSHGAKAFTRKLQNSLRGRTSTVDGCIRQYQTWRKGIEEIEKAIQSQRKIKWQDLSDDFDDDYEEEESRDQLLSKDDPSALQARLEQSVEKAIHECRDSLAATSNGLQSTPDADKKAAFLIRFLREALVSLPTSYKKPLKSTFVDKLYDPLALPISKNVIEKNKKKIHSSLKQRQLAIRSLWNEEQKTPVMPSPWAVKIIRDCHSMMEAAGTDLWTVSSVSRLKYHLLKSLEGEFDTASQDAVAAAKPDQDVSTQQVFDVCYLQEALATSGGKKESIAGLVKHLDFLKVHAQLDERRQERIKNGAVGYWKKTALLFALLM